MNLTLCNESSGVPVCGMALSGNDDPSIIAFAATYSHSLCIGALTQLANPAKIFSNYGRTRDSILTIACQVSLAMVVDSLLQSSNNHLRQIARDHVQPESDTRLGRFSRQGTLLTPQEVDTKS